MDEHIALFVTMHPASRSAQSTLLTNLRSGARGYYRQPSSRCTAWSYLTPLHLKDQKDESLILGGLEIYTSKSALRDQLNDATFFQPFERLVVEEKLYRKEGKMVAWYPAGGFVTRSARPENSGGDGVVVEVRQLSCVGRGERDALVRGLGEFAGWCRGSDAGVLTFAVFTRKKDEGEVLVYVRFRDEGSMKMASDRPEWMNFWKLAESSLVADESSVRFWREVEDSFVWPMSQSGEEKSKL